MLRQCRLRAIRMLYYSWWSIPHTNLQRTAEGGRFVSAESETVQHHRNKTRWFVLVQRYECPWCHMPMCTRSHLLRRIMQEGTLKGNSVLHICWLWWDWYDCSKDHTYFWSPESPPKNYKLEILYSCDKDNSRRYMNNYIFVNSISHNSSNRY